MSNCLGLGKRFPSQSLAAGARLAKGDSSWSITVSVYSAMHQALPPVPRSGCFPLLIDQGLPPGLVGANARAAVPCTAPAALKARGGGGNDLSKQYGTSFACVLICDLDRCPKGATPPSVRYPRRTMQLGAAVILVVLRHGRHCAGIY